MVTGSLVSSLQGEPRSTHDIDLVVDIHLSDIPMLIQAFSPPDYYLDDEMIRDAISHHSMFNLLDVNNGEKVDFWILTSEPFDQSRFHRRYREQFLDIEFHVSKAEDTILAKLRWAQLAGGSEKQFRDALRVYEVQLDSLDMSYLKYWVRQLGLESFWQQVIREAESL
ncbi:hypothetical protein U14_02501 [Candidatus Moduliflexus flocculans]|uniref:Uncharacterized protein n=1 Tax=Candidatus Moduliflexus flocculans TaxID=1499966 RepID=A0A081BLJ2_9BACT|nr:hypothetical protein U14_02501 [Candidatus Moduliflexus flocculans]